MLWEHQGEEPVSIQFQENSCLQMVGKKKKEKRPSLTCLPSRCRYLNAGGRAQSPGVLLLISGGSWRKPPLLQMMPLLVPDVLFCVVF